MKSYFHTKFARQQNQRSSIEKPRSREFFSANASNAAHSMFIEALEDRRMLTTYVVTTTADSGAGSLRDAITAANNNPGLDTIDFNIPGSGIRTITLQSALPSITDPVIIDGSTNSASFATDHTPVVQLDGTNAGANAKGLDLATGSDGSTIKGLAITDFNGDGISVESNGNLIVGNYIGTFDGVTAAPNGTGIALVGSAANHIGDSTPGDGNLISGNTLSGININGVNGSGPNTVQGNLIGVGASGLTSLPNGLQGINIVNSGGDLIGGTTAAERNIISGNVNSGIAINSSESVAIIGNYIGLNATGTLAVGNGDGIEATDSSVNIGGTALGDGNVISGNLMNGMTLGVFASTVQGNFIGTDATGNHAIGNGATGINETGMDGGFANTTIGGSAAGAGNIISGNAGDGIEMDSFFGSDSGIVISGNKIGVAADGSALPNAGNGLRLYQTSGDVLVGGLTAADGNIIQNNDGAGVLIDTGTDISILSNSIDNNGGIGIQLTNGGNSNQAAPALASATQTASAQTTVMGTLSGPAGTYEIQFFSVPITQTGGSEEGQTLLYTLSITLASAGSQAFTAEIPSLVGSDQIITATATLFDGTAPAATSQFAEVAVTPLTPVSPPIVSVSPPATPNSATNPAIPSNPISLASNAHATSPVITGKSAKLLALGADVNGDSTLAYTWSVIKAPSGAKAPTFSINGTNKAEETIATFAKDGGYDLRCTISDGKGHSVTTDVSITVEQTPTALRVTPHAATVHTGHTLDFQTVVLDQFGHALRTPQAATYSIFTGHGTIGASSGIFTASNETGRLLVEVDDGSLQALVAEKIV